MPSSENNFIIASAGSRKTTLLVERALAAKNARVLITTYTIDNLEQIKSYIAIKNGHIPTNIRTMSWYSFLLQEGVRPYQNHLTQRGRVRSIMFGELPRRAENAKKTDVDNYFFSGGNNIYGERTADFVCQCDDQSGSLIVKRLERIFTHIFIDEFQDFAGYDLDLVRKLLESSISVTTACDPRQATFSTNNSSKNQRFKRSGVAAWIRKLQTSGLLSVEEHTICYRSNQEICNFADALYPALPKTVSKNDYRTGHDGIFVITTKEVADYVKKYDPVVLRYNIRASTMGLPAINIGLSKGRTFDRVLIFPTKNMTDYLREKDISKAGDVAKLYVAVTRAKYSVAFVVNASGRKPRTSTTPKRMP
jgi:DNA helicase-2/ATP-dependent DNA helicase PcrA